MLHFARWKTIVIVLVCALATAIAALNLLTPQQVAALPSWLPHRQITLGLDLQGGSHMMLRVDTDAVLHDRLESMLDTVRDELRKATADARESAARLAGQLEAIQAQNKALMETLRGKVGGNG